MVEGCTDDPSDQFDVGGTENRKFVQVFESTNLGEGGLEVFTETLEAPSPPEPTPDVCHVGGHVGSGERPAKR